VHDVRILVYPHDLGIGGSQINAIEIAAQSAAQGHEVCIFGRPGPLVDRIDELGLEFIEAPRPRRRPSPSVVRSLRQVITSRRVDVVHGYEWPPALEAWLATRPMNVSAVPVGTVMSMAVAPFLPRDMPLVVGTEQIAAFERRAGRGEVSTIEPPVDLEHNDPMRRSGQSELAQQLGLSPTVFTVVTVTRLAHELKLEGLLTAIDTVACLAEQSPIRLVIAGDGPARAEVTARAERVNKALEREVITLLGSMSDPRPAYLLGDVHLAMGGSALRALAHAKPLIVQGENGFFTLLTPETVPQFEWTGWYGVGQGPEWGQLRLRQALAALTDDPELRAELGQFGLDVVRRRNDLRVATDAQLVVYEQAMLGARNLTAVREVGRVARSFGRYVAARRIARLRGRANSDDFNSRPVAMTGLAPPSAG
jgi:glycosyltransferase involved in cell wall biosynthesis